MRAGGSRSGCCPLRPPRGIAAQARRRGTAEAERAMRLLGARELGRADARDEPLQASLRSLEPCGVVRLDDRALRRLQEAIGGPDRRLPTIGERRTDGDRVEVTLGRVALPKLGFIGAPKRVRLVVDDERSGRCRTEQVDLAADDGSCQLDDEWDLGTRLPTARFQLATKLGAEPVVEQ